MSELTDSLLDTTIEVVDNINKKDIKRIKELIESDDKLDNKIGVGLALEKGFNIEQLATWALISLVGNLDIDSKEYKQITSNKEKYYQGALVTIKQMLN